METDTSPKFMGGFSLSNLQGPGLAAALIVAAAFAFLVGHYVYFRDVALF